MIKRDRRGHSYCVVRGEILGSMQDELMRKHLPRMFSLITERKLEVRRRSDTALVLTINDANQRSAAVLNLVTSRRAASGKPKSSGSGGSMVAKLKLKGIDGRAPPGVEPAA